MKNLRKRIKKKKTKISHQIIRAKTSKIEVAFGKKEASMSYHSASSPSCFLCRKRRSKTRIAHRTARARTSKIEDGEFAMKDRFRLASFIVGCDGDLAISRYAPSVS